MQMAWCSVQSHLVQDLPSVVLCPALLSLGWAGLGRAAEGRERIGPERSVTSCAGCAVSPLAAAWVARVACSGGARGGSRCPAGRPRRCLFCLTVSEQHSPEPTESETFDDQFGNMSLKSIVDRSLCSRPVRCPASPSLSFHPMGLTYSLGSHQSSSRAESSWLK